MAKKPVISSMEWYCLVCEPTCDLGATVGTSGIEILTHLQREHPELGITTAAKGKDLVGTQEAAIFLDGARGTFHNYSKDRFDMPNGTPVARRLWSQGNM